jgi:uncharacterized protein
VELIRLVRGADGTVFVDAPATAPGRGAYACPTVECLERALVTERLARAFKGAVRSPRESAVEIAEYWRRR